MTNDAYFLELAILHEKHVAGYFSETEYLDKCQMLQDAEFEAMAKVSPCRCSWCQRVIREGNPELPVSHDICPNCAAEYFPGIKLSEAK